MKEKLESRIGIVLICRKEKLNQYYIDPAQFSWQAGDSNNTLKDICDKPQSAPSCKDFPSVYEKKIT